MRGAKFSLATLGVLAGGLLLAGAAWAQKGRAAAPEASPPQAAALGLIALTMGGLVLLGVALGLARASTRPRRRRARGYARGVQEAIGLAPATPEAAIGAVEQLRLGKVVGSQALDGGALRIAVARRRWRSCTRVRGVVAGAFESAWGRDVAVEHGACGGKGAPCVYDVRPVEVSGPARRGAGSGSPGSSGGPGRSRQVRAGG